MIKENHQKQHFMHILNMKAAVFGIQTLFNQKINNKIQITQLKKRLKEKKQLELKQKHFLKSCDYIFINSFMLARIFVL